VASLLKSGWLVALILTDYYISTSIIYVFIAHQWDKENLTSSGFTPQNSPPEGRTRFGVNRVGQYGYKIE